MLGSVVDMAGFIEDITYRIWNGPGRDPELCTRYYGPETAIHTGAGDVVGGSAVVANTRERLAAFPDFHGVIDDTIWTGDEAGGHRTSMRWTWTGTHTGVHAFGAATGRPVRCGAIADCVVRDGVIVEEWLAVNPLALARQLGVADAAAAGLRPTLPITPDAAGPVVVDGRPDTGGEADEDRVVTVLKAGIAGEAITSAYAAGAPIEAGPGPRTGPEWLAGWSRLLGAASARIDDAFSQVGPDGLVRVATRWTVLGPDGPVVTASSHHHVRDGRIVAEWTHYDEITVLARAGGLP